MAPPAKTWDDEEEIVEVGGHRLKIKHLSKVLYPETGTTKAEVIDYYAKIIDFMLPHLRERAVTLKRWPHGVEGESWFEKQCPKYAPDWIPTVTRKSSNTGETKDYCVVNSLATVVWLVNLATLEFHVPLATRRTMDRPKTVVFDLDPGEGASIVECCAVAMLVREALRGDGLESFPKTSGSKGMQLYVPLNKRGVTFEKSKNYARDLAERMTEHAPDLVVANMRKSLRKNRVLIDWSQNSQAKTTICAYSTRGREYPQASTPITWDEVEKTLKSGKKEDLVFDLTDTVDRARDQGDLFAPVVELEQSLPR